MPRPLFILVTSLLLVACSADIRDAKQVLTDSLPIPKDVEFREMKSYPGDVVCGEYSAYESYLASKADFKPFLVVRGKRINRLYELDQAIYCSEEPALVLLQETGIGLYDANNKTLAKITADYSLLADALEAYYEDNHFYPSIAQGLEALVKATEAPGVSKKRKEGGYLETIPLDPWGRPYRYFEEQWGRTRGYYLISTLGADGEEGGEGDNTDVTSLHMRYLQHIARVLAEEAN